jgi:hypothetical protein
MPSLRNEETRNGLIQRLQRLTPETKPHWGKLDAPRLLCHLGDTLAMSLGDISTRSMNIKAFHRFPLKHLIIYVLPFPKGANTAPELLSSSPIDFESDRSRVVELIGRLAAKPDANGPEHPFFGPLTNKEWNALQSKHISHHLKQFGL